MRYFTSRKKFRFGLRTLFAVTTLFALFCLACNLIGQRREAFQRKAALHQSRVLNGCYLPALEPEIVLQDLAYQNFHRKMAEKYRLAAKCPWLIVEEDPMEPPASTRMLLAIDPAGKH